jgi:hypothetical protein
VKLRRLSQIPPAPTFFSSPLNRFGFTFQFSFDRNRTPTPDHLGHPRRVHFELTKKTRRNREPVTVKVERGSYFGAAGELSASSLVPNVEVADIQSKENNPGNGVSYLLKIAQRNSYIEFDMPMLTA